MDTEQRTTISLSNSLATSRHHTAAGEVLSLVQHWFTGTTFLQTRSGALYSARLSGNNLAFAPWHENFPSPCPQMDVMMVRRCDALVFVQQCFRTIVLQIGSEEVVIGLSSRGQLCAQQRVVSPECSSFAIHDSFLLYTTYSHQLRIVPLGATVATTFEQVCSGSDASSLSFRLVSH